MVKNNLLSQEKQDKAVFVKSLFNKIAPVYDLLNNAISLGLHKRWKQIAVDVMNVSENDKVLDLCCGSGDMTGLILSKNLDGLEIKAVDFSSEMLEIAKRRFNSRSEIEIIQADALALPFADASFDHVVISFGLRNLKCIDSGYKEIMRVLKPSGNVVNLDFGKPDFIIICIMFNVYFKFFVPIITKLFNNYSEYRYLSDSIKLFPSPDQLVASMQQAGFLKVVNRNLFFGFVAAQVGYKE